jgi:hypothetical protein
MSKQPLNSNAVCQAAFLIQVQTLQKLIQELKRLT